MKTPFYKSIQKYIKSSKFMLEKLAEASFSSLRSRDCFCGVEEGVRNMLLLLLLDVLPW